MTVSGPLLPVPPEDIHLEDADGALITSRTLEPLPEGSSLRITCVSSGGETNTPTLVILVQYLFVSLPSL